MNEWNNDNELRAYPLVEPSAVRDDILVDAHLVYPAGLQQPRVTAIRVSARLVSITWAAGTVPLCSVTLRDPDPYRNYQVVPAHDGVVGWVMFGSGLAEEYSFLADGDEAVMLPRVCRPYQPAGVASLGKQYSATRLTGVVKLIAGRDLYVRGEDMFVDGQMRRVIAVGIADTDAARSRQKYYAGDCAGRPDDYSCARTPITTVNGVTPDCNGNIDIDVVGDIPWGAISEGGQTTGLMFHYPLGFVDICRDELQLRDRIDLCASSQSSEQPGPQPSSSEVPAPSSSSSISACPPIHGAYQEHFSSNPACFTAHLGTWTADGTYHGSYSSGRGLSVLQGSYSKNRVLRSKVAVNAGLQQRAYFVYCYVDDQELWYAKVDVANQKFTLGRVHNGIEQDLVDIPDTVTVDTFYDLKLLVHDDGGDSGSIDFWVDSVLRTQLTVSSGLQQGQVGYGVKQSNGEFDDLEIAII